jgi:hypothetical protein
MIVWKLELVLEAHSSVQSFLVSRRGKGEGRASRGLENHGT